MATNRKAAIPGSISAPIIGIWSVLLILFNISTPIKTYKLEVRPLQKFSYDISTIDSNSVYLVVVIDKDRKIYLNKEPVEIESLAARVKDIFDKRTQNERVVYFKAPKELPHGFIMHVFDLVKGAGASTIAIQVDYFN